MKLKPKTYPTQSKNEPLIKSLLEEMGWVFNEKAKIGYQWTQTFDNGITAGEDSVTWCSNVMMLTVAIEMNKHRPLSELREEVREYRDARYKNPKP